MWRDPDPNYLCSYCLAVGYHLDECPTTPKETPMSVSDDTAPEHVCTEHQAHVAACEHLHREAARRDDQRPRPGTVGTGTPPTIGHAVNPDHVPCTCAGGQRINPGCRRHGNETNRHPAFSVGTLGKTRGPEVRMGDCLLEAEVKTAQDAAYFCNTARDIVSPGGDRRRDYGDATESFDTIGRLWAEVLGQPVTGEQVALCQALLKMARLLQKIDHTDSWVDIIGYASLGGQISHGRHTT